MTDEEALCFSCTVPDGCNNQDPRCLLRKGRAALRGRAVLQFLSVEWVTTAVVAVAIGSTRVQTLCSLNSLHRFGLVEKKKECGVVSWKKI